MDESNGPMPYAYEPVFTDQELERRIQSDESDGDETDSTGDDDPPPPPDRMQSRDWCTCGNCEPLDSETQCICCHEVGNCEKFINDVVGVNCVIENEDFRPVCLHRAVLRTALVARLDCRGHARRRLPPVLENVSYRYAAYRMFTYWTHGLLGKRVRRVIPACVLKTIRGEFPADDGIYVFFKDGDDEDDAPVREELGI